MKKLHVEWYGTGGPVEISKVMEGPCEYCLGTGVYHKPNGEDDYDPEFCTCEVGKHAEHIASNELQHHGN